MDFTHCTTGKERNYSHIVNVKSDTIFGLNFFSALPTTNHIQNSKRIIAID